MGIRGACAPADVGVVDEVRRRIGGAIGEPLRGVSPTTAEHVRADLGHDVELILDAGRAQWVSSHTIVDCTVDPPQILRPGGIATEDIAALLPGALDAQRGTSRAPGMRVSHYAPRCRVVLVDPIDDADRLRSVTRPPRSSTNPI